MQLTTMTRTSQRHTLDIVPPAGLRESEAARYTGLTQSFLRAARVGRCEGPAYCRVGRAIVYLRPDLDAFLLSRRVS